MLIEFSVENFLSIKERQTFSMLSFQDDESLPDNYFAITAIEKENVLKSAMIYGANASGKTNLLKSLEFVVRFVKDSHRRQKGEATGVKPFRLSKEYVKSPSCFEITFVYENVKYEYGFKADKHKIHEEFLYYFSGGEKILVFSTHDTNLLNLNIFRRDQILFTEKNPGSGATDVYSLAR